MSPAIQATLKLASIAFAVLWTLWMVWWSGIYDAVNVSILAVCGLIGGHLWYRAMRWQFKRMMAEQNDDPSS